MIYLVIRFILGIIIFISGISLSFLYIDGLEKGNNQLLLLVLSALLATIGIFLLISVAKLHKAKMENMHKIRMAPGGDISISEKAQPINLIARNIDLINSWRKTEKIRDRLKMLKLSAEANNK